ncbi:hypothetical protein BpHYR1_004673 [Brachionus plicatilis]|uniref:Uncharacterized protein n=1 Tax=Brachionus plicatilis TaxID=10195 RepID=A0A3M7S004_BRAPC|nr:hypothetical protein BpHYR1_004673 [Brachionus plicatilis]
MFKVNRENKLENLIKFFFIFYHIPSLLELLLFLELPNGEQKEKNNKIFFKNGKLRKLIVSMCLIIIE